MSEAQVDTARLSVELLQEASRLVVHPLREVRRLEHEAAAGETAATPLILLVGVAVSAWVFAAIVLAAVLAASALFSQ
jgi:hypothetical protein